MTTADTALSSVLRNETGRIVAFLTGLLGDFDVAEESVADAVEMALIVWRRDGVPDRPGGWLLTTAKRKAIDQLRRRHRGEEKLRTLAARHQQEAPEMISEFDAEVGLLFTCCDPRIPLAGRIALTLRAVVGLSTDEIARAFLLSTPTVAQRIVRAKRLITAPLVAPTDLRHRLDDVLTVVYLAYNEGHLPTTGVPDRKDLAEDAIWLATRIAAVFEDEPETLGLLALLLLQHARRHARIDHRGQLVLLSAQDRARWDRPMIAEGIAFLRRAAMLGKTGRYCTEAAIAAVHSEARDYADTDWPQILALYDRLSTQNTSPVVRLNRAVALAKVDGPRAALSEVDELARRAGGGLERFHLWYAVRAHLLRELGQHAAAADADARALALATNPAERALLRHRVAAGSTSPPESRT